MCGESMISFSNTNIPKEETHQQVHSFQLRTGFGSPEPWNQDWLNSACILERGPGQ